ncbi:MAG: hypothetical protein LBS75_09480, partial [Synergistaceae bacterium]|nr:hypothetical protein [Synergistaceae bacterium]
SPTWIAHFRRLLSQSLYIHSFIHSFILSLIPAKVNAVALGVAAQNLQCFAKSKRYRPETQV